MGSLTIIIALASLSPPAVAASAVKSTIVCKTISDFAHVGRLLESGDKLATNRLMSTVCRTVPARGYVEQALMIGGESVSCLRQPGEVDCYWTFSDFIIEKLGAAPRAEK